MAVHADSDGLTVALQADLPGLIVKSAPRPVDELLLDLPNGLSITVDGQTVPTEVVRSTRRGDLVSPGTEILEVLLRARAPMTGLHELEVSNGNLPGVPGWFFAEAFVAPSVRLVDSDLVVVLRDGTVEVLADAWSRSERRRRIRMTVDATPGPWASTVARMEGPLAEERVAEAWPRSTVEAWKTGHPRRDASGLELAWAALAAAAAGRAAPRGRRALATTAAASLAGVLLGWALAPSPTLVLGLLAASVVGAALGPAGAFLLAAALGVGAATVVPHAWAPLAALLALPSLGLAAIKRPERPRGAMVTTLVLAAAAAARWGVL